MKTFSFIIFISIVLFVYVSVNYYIYIRGLAAIPKDSVIRNYYIITFLILSLSFWAGRILESFFNNILTDSLVVVGSLWLAFMLYFFLFALLFDLLRLSNFFFSVFPKIIETNYAKVKLIALFSTILITTAIVIYGSINFLTPKIEKIELTLPKKNSNIKMLNIAAASDIHLGTIVGKSRLNDLVAKINSLNADIILLAGDIFDEDIGPVIQKNLGDDLRKLKSKYGTFAVTGNHEYIGGAEAAVNYMEEHGIKVLRDNAILIDSSFYLVGREDKDKERFSEFGRKELNEITSTLPGEYPLILLDHQPLKLETAEKNKIDLQISGHTHHGQLWPLNYVTSMIYEISYGYKKIGDTHYYVSSGFAGWGPPVRTGSRAEVVNIKINFE